MLLIPTPGLMVKVAGIMVPSVKTVTGERTVIPIIHQRYKQGRALWLFRLEIANKGGA